MRKIVLLWMGVLVCSAVAMGAFEFTIGDGQYEGSVRLEGQESLLVTGGGHTGLKPLMSAMLRYRTLPRIK